MLVATDAASEDAAADAALDAPSCLSSEGPRGSSRCDNGEDDDCDGLVDRADPDCLCADSDDCDDAIDCTADLCVDGDCQYEAAPDGTACTAGCVMNGECAAGERAGGEALDADGDGDPPTRCDGSDCDDRDPDRAGAFFEGPFGDALCADGIDNDCDDGVDHLDASCNPPICRESWCWASPQPQGEFLADLAAIGEQGLIAVGTFGTILHWDGRTWARRETGTTADLEGVWVAGDDDAWAVGAAGTILRFDGSTWSSVTSPTMADLTAVSGVRTDLAWAVGSGGELLRWNGAAWSAVTSGTMADLHTIEAIGVDEAWAGGDDGLLLRWDGGSWSPQAAGITGAILSIATLGGGLLIGDEDGQLVRYDGSTFRPDDTYETLGDITDILVVAPDEVLLVSYFGSTGRIRRWDGSSWESGEEFSPGVKVLAMTRSGEVWGAGDQGRLIHQSGRFASYSFHIGSHSPSRAWPASATELWLGAGFEGIQVWDGVRWRAVDVPGTVAEHVYGFASDDVWVTANEANLLHWDGTTWTETSTFDRAAFYGLWGRASDDMWTVLGDGSGYDLIRWDGTGWTRSRSAFRYASLSGTADGQMWAVGPSVLHWDGSAWDTTRLPEVDVLNDVYAVTPDDVWAVGRRLGRGVIAHFDGSAWSISRSSLPSQLLSVWAGAADDVWTTGDDGILLHYDGSAWTLEPRPSRWLFRHVRARGGTAWLSYQGAMVYRVP